MLHYPEIDPVLLSLGPLRLHWYGLMYLVGFFLAWRLALRRAHRLTPPCQPHQIEDLIFFGALGVVLGGRVGYVLFYGLEAWRADPLYPLKVWQGGMSFHGGLLGVLLAMVWQAHREGRRFFAVADFVAPLVPLGLFAGRIGNFINGELWGRTTSVPWGIQLPCWRFPEHCQGSNDLWSPPVHPSQLYEAALEGLLLFVLLWWFSRRPRPAMATSGLFLLGYGLMRALVESVRMPDAHIGFLAWGWLTMGQLLSLPMILGGLALLILAYRATGRTTTTEAS